MIKKRVLIFVLVVIMLSIVGCKDNTPTEFKRDVFALDTYITITAYSDKNIDDVLDKAIERLAEIENRMSATIEDSDVNLINRNAGISPVKVNEDTLFVIKRGIYYGELTDGAFDITVYPIARLWGITDENPQVPTDEAIQELLPLVNYRDVVVNDENQTVFLSREGMMIDLGGIAKGFVGDEIARILKESGIEHALINLGGDILVVGDKIDNTLWRIGIQDPRAEGRQRHFVTVEASDETIVSSGDYERYMIQVFEETGIRYHHIFDPRTGYPSDTGLISTTVVGKSAVDTDVMSTAAFILGLNDAMSLVESMEETHGIFVTTDKDVYITEEYKDRVNKSSPDYRIAN